MTARKKEDMDAMLISKLASWAINDEPRGLTLQIELGNDYAVTLTIRDGEPPTTTLWCGNSEQSFQGQERESFRAWLDEITPWHDRNLLD